MMLLLVYSLAISTALYYWLRIKTHMQPGLLLIDNPMVGLIAFCLSYLSIGFRWPSLILIPVLIPLLAFILIQIRFWRTPRRKITAKDNEIVSPADGNVIYINRIDPDSKLISVKNGSVSELSEITQSDLILRPCWQIGINMTPFDVHKNCSPISGNIIFNKHIIGKFHSLKDFLSMTENERHTYVIENKLCRVGVVQIASKRVKRIDSYVKQGDAVKQGEWLGMIRFGSQVDVFLPLEAKINIELRQQVYAAKTILAELP